MSYTQTEAQKFVQKFFHPSVEVKFRKTVISPNFKGQDEILFEITGEKAHWPTKKEFQKITDHPHLRNSHFALVNALGQFKGLIGVYTEHVEVIKPLVLAEPVVPNPTTELATAKAAVAPLAVLGAAQAVAIKAKRGRKPKVKADETSS